MHVALKFKMHTLKMVITGVLLLFVLHSCSCTTYADQRRLHDLIKSSFDPRIRPTLDQTKAINVTVIPHLSAFIKLDAREQILKTSFGLELEWSQDIFTWNMSEFSDMDMVTVPQEQTWIPGIHVLDTITTFTPLTEASEDLMVLLYSNGRVKLSVWFNLDTKCEVTITMYPFDVQTCHIIIGKLYDTDKKMIMAPETERLEIWNRNHDEWSIISTGVKQYVYHPDFTGIAIKINIRRKPAFYIINIFIPIFVLCFLNILSFMIPPECGERISYCVSLFLTLSVLLNAVSDSVPKVSNVSFLQVFVILDIVFSAFITIMSIAIVRYEHLNRHEDVCDVRRDDRPKDEFNDANAEKSNDVSSNVVRLDFAYKVDTYLFRGSVLVYILAIVAFILICYFA
ncbi:neuronal acetylcholine receptor subunit beta-4-like [Dreissena polymorpha]|nr:neuronal acetylcholine receptor subunit beta-4-like [Dreissena polymorpha]